MLGLDLSGTSKAPAFDRHAAVELERGVRSPQCDVRAFCRCALEGMPQALLLQAFCSVRTKRQLVEQLKYNLLVCRFKYRRNGIALCGILLEPRLAAYFRGDVAVLCRGEPAGQALHER